METKAGKTAYVPRDSSRVGAMKNKELVIGLGGTPTPAQLEVLAEIQTLNKSKNFNIIYYGTK